MTERYLGSIISPSPVEPSSNLSTATASGVWHLHDPLIFGQAGDWPDPTNTPSTVLISGGYNNSVAAINVIEFFIAEVSSNATDFGDLSVTRGSTNNLGNDT